MPANNNAMGHHPQRAYAFASLGIVAAAWSALAMQLAFVSLPNLLMALYEFVLVTIVALVVNRSWSQKLDKVVNLIIAPILVIVGIRFIFMAIWARHQARALRRSFDGTQVEEAQDAA